jgi:hypothetical protein
MRFRVTEYMIDRKDVKPEDATFVRIDNVHGSYIEIHNLDGSLRIPLNEWLGVKKAVDTIIEVNQETNDAN